MLTFAREDLQTLESQSLRRRLRVIDRARQAVVESNGVALINFGSNDYLALSHHPRVTAAAQKAAADWGTGAGASRLISGSTALHDRLEQRLAAFVNREAALVFPSGYMANLAIVTALVGPGDAIIADRLCHASLIDAARLSGARLLVYRHAEPAEAAKALKRARSFRRRLLITESLFSMDGDVAPVPKLLAACRATGTISLIDDAHALGVLGDQGNGLGHGSDVVVGTLSKSFGSQGGFVAASRPVIDLLVNRSRPFIFTTGLSPVVVAAADAALDLIRNGEDRRSRLRRLSTKLRGGLQDLGWNTLTSSSQIVPVHAGSAARVLRMSQGLQNSGFLAPAIRPPTVHAGQCRIRFSLTAAHSNDDIEKLLAAAAGLKETIRE